jgi:hypothetical protein
MISTRTAGLAAMVALAAALPATAQDQTDQAKLDALRSEIAALKGASGNWLTEERADEIRAIVADVLADAQTRGSLQGTGATSGYSDGFFLSSTDGSYSMKINVLQQIRWSFNDNEDDTAAGGGGGGGGGVAGAGGSSGQAYGFENKRTRLGFSGNMVDSSWTYDVKYALGYSNSVEEFGAGELSDAFVTKALECGATVTVGQFKLPFSAEYAIDAGNLQFMDYSTVESTFGAGYGQGIRVGYASGDVRVAAAYVNAIREANAAWTADSPTSEWAFAGRAEAKFAGTWQQFEQSQSWRGDSYGIKVGAGFAVERDNTFSDATTSALTADFTVALGGANVTAAYYVYSFDDSGLPGVDDSNPMALVISAGVFVSDTCDVALRYEYGDADQDFGGAETFSALTVGSNWYLARNKAKWGVDLGYAFDAVSAIYAPTAAGNNWLQDATNENGQWVFRTQLSFSF